MAQHGPQQRQGLPRRQAAAARDEGAVDDPRCEILKRRPLVVVGIYGAWGPSHLAAFCQSAAMSLPTAMTVPSPVIRTVLLFSRRFDIFSLPRKTPPNHRNGRQLIQLLNGETLEAQTGRKKEIVRPSPTGCES